MRFFRDLQRVGPSTRDRRSENARKNFRRIQTFGRRMRHVRLRARERDRLRFLAPGRECDGRETHQAPVARRMRIGASDRSTRSEIARKSRTRGVANVETTPRDAVLAFTPPTHEAPGEIIRFDGPSVGDQTIGEAERHRRIIGPFAWFQAKRTAANQIGHVIISVALLELDRRSERVTDREADESAECAVASRIVLIGGCGAQGRLFAHEFFSP